jgi:hypothetical protein
LIAQGQSLIPGLSDAQRTAMRNALHTGIAMQHAANLQAITKKAIATGRPLQRLLQVGQTHIARDPVAQAARASLNGKGEVGYAIGTGLAQHQTTPFQVAAVRAPLNKVDAHGFDTAAALHLGRVTAPSLGPAVHPAVQAGHAIAHGARVASPGHQAALVATAASTSAGAVGAKLAAAQIAKARAGRGWLIDVGLIGGGLVLGALGGASGAIIGATVGGVIDILRRGALR